LQPTQAREEAAALERSPRFLIVAGFAFASLASLALSAVPASIHGRVVDSRGRPVPGARLHVAASSGGREAAATADGEGRFELALVSAAEARSLVTVRVQAVGFAERTLELDGSEDPLVIALAPITFADETTVTAARMPARVRETPASVVAISSDDMASAAALPVDAILRQVPGFTLFRRSDSRVANPTTQGASLRGVGGSGASRALVLDDGVALNDPFGGWIAWGRVVDESLDRIEVLRGGASDLYGAPALSGVIQMVRRDDAAGALDAEASYGSLATADGSAFLAAGSGAWGLRIGAEAFRTDGYGLLPDGQAGAVDVAAGSRHEIVDATLERRDSAARVFLRGQYYDEARGNGTPLQVNDTQLWQLSAGTDGVAASSRSTWSLRAYGLHEDYHQTFSAVAADRDTETLIRDQTVPSSAAGVSAQWETTRGDHQLLAGMEGRWVEGESDEIAYAAAGDRIADAGGRQATGAVMIQDRFAVGPRLSLAASLRYDDWRNFDAFRRQGPAGSDPTKTPLASRSADAWSPRLGAVFQASPEWALTANGYRSFRAPTLNELYRSFRVGNTLTLANETLGPERLWGAELGAMCSPPGSGVFARVVGFWMEIDGSIANVTTSVTDALITRQRQNLGRTRSRGVEADAEVAIARGWLVSAGWLYADSSVTSFPADPTLEGLRVPQVPRHQATLQLRRDGAVLRAAIQGRYGGAQFEDDANQLRLPGFTAIDARVGVSLTQSIEAFAAGENLTGKRYVVGKTPLVNLGPPRQLRGGIRVRLD
jgi:outer membrane receptor protein involved in Fe transport